VAVRSSEPDAETKSGKDVLEALRGKVTSDLTALASRPRTGDAGTDVWAEAAADVATAAGADVWADAAVAALAVDGDSFDGVLWATDLMAEARATVATYGAVDIRETSQIQESWGAALLLAEWLDGGDFGETVKRFFGFECTRLISFVTDRQPITAVAIDDDGTVLGLADLKQNGYVFNLFVSPSCRRQRLGSRLLAWCANKAWDRGARELWMHVDLTNAEGLEFYERLGFAKGPQEAFGSDARLGFRLSKSFR